jgi:hypothetical protein
LPLTASAAAPEHEAREQRDADGADYDGHRVGLGGAAGTGQLSAGLAGEDFTLGHAVIGDVAGDVLRAVRVAIDGVAGLMAEIAPDFARQIGAFMSAVVGGLPGGAVGDAARLMAELLQMVLRYATSLHGIPLQIAGQATGVTVFDTIQPSHVTLTPDFKGKRWNRLSSSSPCSNEVRRHMHVMSTDLTMSTPQARLDRQFDRIGRQFPATAGFLKWLRRPNMALIRVPVGFLLILGGVFSFLPILGAWMLPLGLLVLAIDIPPLKKPVGDGIVRLQRWISLTRRKWRKKAASQV